MIDIATRQPLQRLASYTSYQEAQGAVDRLSDLGFPVERASIVGEDVHIVERVTGRLTTARAAALGAVQGLWVGLALGLILSIVLVLSPGQFLLALLFPVAFSAAFAAGTHAFSRGRRDFSSLRYLDAGRYSVMVEADYSENARRLLSGLAS